ncbi:MAG: hypothetical protein ACLFU5_00175 [Thermoplasmata archaeon]
MIDIEKALMAIEEKEKWEEREKEVLEELEKVRKKKKELKKQSKKLKERINECESALRSMSPTSKNPSDIYLDLTEELKRI